MDDMKLAWVGLNHAYARVVNALHSLSGIPSLSGDDDLTSPDSLDSFIGLVELDLLKIKNQIESKLVEVEKEIKDNEVNSKLQVLR